MSDIYSPITITRRVIIPFKDVNSKITETLQRNIASEIEGKCINHGYVRSNSVKNVVYSSGITSGSTIIYDVKFECLVFFPTVGMLLNCVPKSITKKAGITAVSADNDISPFILFISKDQYYDDPLLNLIDIDDKFVAKVILHRFELNDPEVSIIAKIVHKI